MSLTPQQTQAIVHSAAQLLRQRNGRNPLRLSDAVADQLDIRDDEAVYQAVIGNWAAINSQAGLGELNYVSSDAMYCTELYLEFGHAALDGRGELLRYASTSFHEGGSRHGLFGVRAFICEPPHLLVSPHFTCVAAVGAGRSALENMLKTHVLGPGAQRSVR